MIRCTINTTVILFCLFVILGCENPVSENGEKDNDTAGEHAKVAFNNTTQFYVEVHRDAFSGPVILELDPGESDMVEDLPSDNYGVGSTFCVTYRFNVAEETDAYSGKVFASGPHVPDAQINFVIEKGKSYAKQIPVPAGITFDSSFLRIKNNSASHFELARYGTSFKQAGNGEIPVPSGKTGIYRLTNTGLSGFRIQSVFQETLIPEFPMQKGYVYDLVFADNGSNAMVIADIGWKIKPEPVTKWRKEIIKYNAANFTDIDADLNSHLVSSIRYGLSWWRYHYPLSKLIYSGGALVSGMWNFGVIPAIVEHTGKVDPYEIPLILAKDAEWNQAVIPSMGLYAGTLSSAYQTTFNDIIKVNNNYVILSTYTKGWRTGLWIFFLNENGQIVESWDIAPGNNKESLMGTKLVNLEGNAFLVLGNKKTYTNADDELSAASSAFIHKYQHRNAAKVWSTEYSHPMHNENYAICGLELPDSYIVCGYADDAYSAKTMVLKVNKANGTVMDAKSFGLASDTLRPFAAGSDNTGYIYISGIATEGSGSRAYILKLDSSYTQVWLKKYGDRHDNFLFDLDITNNLLTAAGSGNDGTVADPYFYGWQAGSAWILRIDTVTGVAIKEAFDTAASAFNSIVKLDDGGFVLAAIKSIDNTKPYWFNAFAVKVNEHLEFE